MSRIINIIVVTAMAFLVYGPASADAFVTSNTACFAPISRGGYLDPAPSHPTKVPVRPTYFRGGNLEAVKKVTASSSSVGVWIQKISNHPIVQAVSALVVSLYETILRELRNLNSNQRWIVAGIFLLGIQVGRSLSSLVLRRFKDAVDIPTIFYGPQAPCLKGVAVKVSDGDTLRFLHTPTMFHPRALVKKEKLAENTLPIRICTIDTPETAKFGKSGQPFGEEAKEKMKGLVESKNIEVRLLSKDQYGRAVGQVFVPRRLPFLPRQGVDEIMLKEGLAEVYQGMGAVYGSLGKDAYLELEEEARSTKKGMWSQGTRESAAEYKKRTK